MGEDFGGSKWHSKCTLERGRNSNIDKDLISEGRGITELKGFAAWNVLFKNKIWLSLGNFIYLQQTEELGFTSKVLSPGREA